MSNKGIKNINYYQINEAFRKRLYSLPGKRVD